MPSIAGPKFVYAHVLSPHHPYIFGAEGETVEEASQDNFYTIGGKPKEAVINKDGYLNQLEFIDVLAIKAISRILESSRIPPIIILQSDHGPDFYGSELTHSGKELPTMDDIAARFSILNAYYLPGTSHAQIYDTITPVNTFRVIFNAYFGADFKTLSDRNYYSPDGAPFNFKDFTDELHKSNQPK